MTLYSIQPKDQMFEKDCAFWLGGLTHNLLDDAEEEAKNMSKIK